ncbi:MAG: Zn-dependent hydrolase [Bacteroidetes bacterium]|nr:Zn-dependent hydrolase [Bacteroidota bacterium]MDA0873801.1 Zn-dependent hydrolase [Bacteroidota bacterium]
MQRLSILMTVLVATLTMSACTGGEEAFDCAAFLADGASMKEVNVDMQEGSEYGRGLLSQYTSFRLTTDLTVLSENECRMLPHLFAAADQMEAIFWKQAYGDREALLASIEDPALREYAMINFGPWDRINGNTPFVDGVGEKPAGSNLYPKDMTKAEFEAAVAANPDLAGLYTVVVRDADETLKAIPYHEAFAEEMQAASTELLAAAEYADDPGLKRYLALRAEALLTGDYFESDMAWMDMKDNRIEMVVGPIETYEDALYGYKAAAEAFVLVKDMAWSERLSRYAQLLPMLQEGLPVPAEYKAETPGTDSDLNAYDAIYYAGDTNAGSKTIAINLPNDEQVQLAKGTRRLQLKNSMQAKFDKILAPISELLIAEDQRQNVTFDAFFGNTMFHEVAHGLGIKNTLDGSSTVREALKEHYSALEEGKADILGLYMVAKLIEEGEEEGDIRDNMATFLAGIFRSVRFGASSAHGRANMIRFNFFSEMGAFTRDEATGTYRADYDKMIEAMNALTEKILRFQGDGDYAGVAAFVEEYARVPAQLQADLDRLAQAGIPVDIVFEQGLAALPN